MGGFIFLLASLVLLGLAIYQSFYLSKAKSIGEIETGMPRKIYRRSNDSKEFERRYKITFRAQFALYFCAMLFLAIFLFA
jgi:hypothetical protein